MTQNDFVKLRELKRLQEQMAAVVKEKLALRALDKFGGILSEWLKKDDNNPAEEGGKFVVCKCWDTLGNWRKKCH